ncbi:MAG: GNAT family N-acetyltransferase [Myxococcales bacterium]|nr:GNAT family N-acetyltransferase [Myxococcales bacterium]
MAESEIITQPQLWTVRSMQENDIDKVVDLAHSLIGANYYDVASVRDLLARCRCGDEQLAFVAEQDDKIVGFRFTFGPGRWQKGRGQGLSPHLWPADMKDTAYFQSAFVVPALMGFGVGGALAKAALTALRNVRTRAVVAHCWKESPHNSSFRYLSKLGFVPVAEYSDYWVDVPYECARDGHPCRCTAIEMVLDLGPQMDGIL